jgi:hypothetical protein
MLKTLAETSFAVWVNLLVLLLSLLLPSWLDGTFFLSSCSRKHTRWTKGCLCTHVFFSSASLTKFGNGLCSVCWPYVGLSTPTLDGFCKGKDFLQLFCLLTAYCTMDHEKNLQLCVVRINMNHGFYGGTYESHCPQMDDPVGPKTIMLIWDTDASFGLTPFWSDFIDYVKWKIPVWVVTKINKVIGIRTTLHKFTDVKGLPVYLPCFCITYQRQMFVYSLHKCTTWCMVDTLRSIASA